MNKTILYQLLALLLLFGITTTSNAQVTIGAGTKPSAFSVLELSTESTKGGLRLPHLTAGERKILSDSPEFQLDKDGLAKGLTIYNTTIECIEYWDTRKWVSLCLGSASFILKAGGVEYIPSDVANELHEDGGETPELTIEDTPPCTGVGKPFAISIIIGGDFAFINHVDEASGKFSLNVSRNHLARDRQIIVRITNNCIGEYKEYIFVQNGNVSLCGNGTIPDTPAIISSSATNEICNGGSVHLYIDPASIAGNLTNPEYIWTSNEVELGRGMSYTATTSGTYMVYAGGIGCENLGSGSIKVKLKSDIDAPGKPSISANNGGTICGGVAVSLKLETALTAGQTIQWYKDGAPIAGATNATYQVNAGGKGSYFAMLIDGGCQSIPSDAITVDEKPGSAPLDFQESYVLINGKPMNLGIILCADGLMDMKIDPAKVKAYTYRWYLNGDLLGIGREVSHIVGQSSGTAQFWVEASIPGDANTCPKTLPSGTITITTGQTPTNVKISGASYFCSNEPDGTMLTASWTEATTGTKYRWINTNNNKEDTKTDDATFYMGQLGAGKYKVIITSAAGCVGESAQTHDVNLLGAPLLNWKVANPEVGENKANTFVIDNTGATATQYIWKYTPTTGNALPSTNLTTITGNTAAITFTGSGTGVLSAEAVGICGRNTLNLTLTITSDLPQAPTVDPAVNNVTVCNGQLFTVTNIASYKAGAKVKWTVVKAGGTGTAFTITQYGTFNEYCHVNFTGVNTTVNVTAQVVESGVDGNPTTITSIQGSKSAADVTQWTIKADGTASFAYDIAVHDYGPNSKCGELNKRVNPNFGQDKEYSINTKSGSTAPTSVKWSVTDIKNLLDITNTDLTGTTAKIRIKESLRDENAEGNLVTNQNGEKFTLTATIIVGTCSYVYSQDVWIKDCLDCPTTFKDLEGYEYTAARFGDAGCWMTQNLRSTKNNVLTLSPNTNAGNSNTLLAYYYPNKNTGILTTNPEYGLLYTWPAANGSTTPFETISNGSAGATRSPTQGICPEGWVLPSDNDWNMLEKEIATTPAEYSTHTTPLTWQPTWESTNGWRPGTAGANNWGQNMKSKTAVNGTATAGKSNVRGVKGFDALLVGYMLSGNASVYGTDTYFWSSSAYSATVAWNRTLGSSTTGTNRGGGDRFVLFSVRCKKNDN